MINSDVSCKRSESDGYYKDSDWYDRNVVDEL